MSADTEALERFYAALNRDDMQAVMQALHSEIVRVEPEGFPTSGTYRGIAEVREQFVKARATWAEGACTPEKILANGDTLVVYVHVRVRLKTAAEWLEGRIADGFKFRDGKIIEFHTFTDRARALAWAGISD